MLHAQLTPSYNCAHYVCDVWELEVGQDIRPTMACFLARPGERTAGLSLVRELERLAAPVDPCIVLFRRAKATPHVGVFIRGRVLHLDKSGPIRQLIAVARIGFHSVRYYAPRKVDHRPV